MSVELGADPRSPIPDPWSLALRRNFVSRAPSSGRLSLAVLLVVVLAGALAFVAVPRLMQTGTSGQQKGGSVPPNNYPKMGHAPDYSWVAGQVAFTRIQGGCTYIRTAAVGEDREPVREVTKGPG